MSLLKDVFTFDSEEEVDDKKMEEAFNKFFKSESELKFKEY